MRHPIRAIMLAPLTIIPLAILITAILHIIDLVFSTNSGTIFGWYAVQLLIPAVLIAYLFTGLYLVPILTAAQMRNIFLVLLVGVIPVVFLALFPHMTIGIMFIVALFADTVAFSRWFIGNGPGSG